MPGPYPDDIDSDCYTLAIRYIGDAKSDYGETPDADVDSLARHIEATVEAWCKAHDYEGPPVPSVTSDNPLV